MADDRWDEDPEETAEDKVVGKAADEDEEFEDVDELDEGDQGENEDRDERQGRA